MKEKKGFTLVELIISVTLISVVVLFMFRLILDVKYERENAGYAVKNQINRSEIIKVLEDDSLRYGIKSISNYSSPAGNKGYSITLGNDEKKYLYVDGYNNKKLKYHNPSKNWIITDSNYIFGDPEKKEIEGYVIINFPVVNLQGDNESSIDDIIITFKLSE